MNEPDLTLVIPAGVDTAQLDRLLAHLADTQPMERVELLLVTWRESCDAHAATADRHRATLLPVERDGDLDEALAEAVRRARAEVVVMLEDHVRPEGAWVEGMIRMFREGEWAAVGWTMRPGNPPRRVVWSGFLAEYGLWGPGTPAGEVHDHLPGHNCAYRRSTLVALGDDLPLLLRGESLLHWRLLADGHRLCFTDAFTNYHSQYDRLGALLISNFWYGRMFGDARRRTGRWSALRRLAFSLAVPLKPLLRWRGLLRAPIDRSQLPPGILWRAAPEITLTYLVGAVGESLGVLFGEGASPARCAEYKLGRARNSPA